MICLKKKSLNDINDRRQFINYIYFVTKNAKKLGWAAKRRNNYMSGKCDVLIQN